MNRAVVKAAAVEAAMKAGIRPERAGDFGSLLDLSSVSLLDEDTPDEAALKQAVRAGIQTYPELLPRSPYGRTPGGRRIPI